MRRRQSYHVTEQYEKTAEMTKEIEKPAKKGYCKHCKEYIGRGVGLHEKRCKG